MNARTVLACLARPPLLGDGEGALLGLTCEANRTSPCPGRLSTYACAPGWTSSPMLITGGELSGGLALAGGGDRRSCSLS